MIVRSCRLNLTGFKPVFRRFSSSFFPEEEKAGDGYIKYKEKSVSAPDRRWVVESDHWKEQTRKGFPLEKQETLHENFETSRNEAEWKAVQSLLPLKEIPLPPKHKSYPTPSGWVPPSSTLPDEKYHIRRTRFHQLPVYLESRLGGWHHLTVIRYCDGDLWALEADLRAEINKVKGEEPLTQVDEVCGKVRLKGAFLKEVSDFLISKGF
ncbi:DgyrCDS11441 [Dimorphilus gyrociliatus]|uniref:Large ribosomal subunit protein mL49 n=1 Tax=Dimorphilus gyrociliatus TaxID=2664684 RepID=A0A7I8W3H9_9ANNE|nr:DgyrCDS11441 [Dimorphilus gyrociliatus]